jgi:hypothetical protein
MCDINWKEKYEKSEERVHFLEDQLQVWYKFLNYQTELVTYLCTKDEELKKLFESPREPIGSLPEFDPNIFKR